VIVTEQDDDDVDEIFLAWRHQAFGKQIRRRLNRGGWRTSSLDRGPAGK